MRLLVVQKNFISLPDNLMKKILLLAGFLAVLSLGALAQPRQIEQKKPTPAPNFVRSEHPWCSARSRPLRILGWPVRGRVRHYRIQYRQYAVRSAPRTA